jgi:very-short-patch-repair endonuclease
MATAPMSVEGWRVPAGADHPYGSHAALKLWGLLRDGGVGGCQFRKRQTICGHLLSFYCPTKRLAVELVECAPDPILGAYPRLRDFDLENRGVVLLQFREEDVLRDLDSIGFLIGVVAQSLPDYPDPAGWALLLSASRPLVS